MRIDKFIDFSQEVEIELSSDDISLILREDPESLNAILSNLNSVATFLKGVPSERIGELSDWQREVIAAFLTSQANRYKEATP
ncbi:hypothetical protein LCGC14_2359870 [marine sediment metagenome]|uniref:Uncharacterized protein n=1 Tax=marine sediment metagenome TaxID=412755 RepID=A0A0F9F1S1_9ZZZZ